MEKITVVAEMQGWIYRLDIFAAPREAETVCGMQKKKHGKKAAQKPGWHQADQDNEGKQTENSHDKQKGREIHLEIRAVKRLIM